MAHILLGHQAVINWMTRHVYHKKILQSTPLAPHVFGILKIVNKQLRPQLGVIILSLECHKSCSKPSFIPTTTNPTHVVMFHHFLHFSHTTLFLYLISLFSSEFQSLKSVSKPKKESWWFYSIIDSREEKGMILL